MSDFASLEYWDRRFTRDTACFDWLIPASEFSTIIHCCTANIPICEAEVLHIGCGTSSSSFLRDLVDNPDQIHNVDYSRPAVTAASHLEQRALEQLRSLNGTRPQPMRWSQADLLSVDSTLSMLSEQSSRGKLFDVVLDKSTSDSISCGPDVSLTLSYPLAINSWPREVSQIIRNTQTGKVHPLHVLAVNLAALTPPNTGKWIVISYSEDRFPFLPPLPSNVSDGFLPDSIVDAGFPHPCRLWELETKERIVVDEKVTEEKGIPASNTVHRPQISHWLYVLTRTDALVNG